MSRQGPKGERDGEPGGVISASLVGTTWLVKTKRINGLCRRTYGVPAQDIWALRSMMQPTRIGQVERKSFSDMHCSVAQCLEVVGEWWSMLILRDVFLGVTRFDDFQERLGISRNILNQRLNGLVEAGVLVKVPYSEHPPRFDYRLTDKGRDLWPIITTMREWGDKYAAPSGPPMLVTHKGCGQVSHAVMTCSACGETIGPRDVCAVPGPGAVEPLVGLARR